MQTNDKAHKIIDKYD